MTKEQFISHPCTRSKSKKSESTNKAQSSQEIEEKKTEDIPEPEITMEKAPYAPLDNYWDDLSDYTLKKFTNKSKLIFESLQNKSFTEDIIYLPNILFTKLFRDERFEKLTNNLSRNFQFIRVVNRRNLVDKYIDKIVKNEYALAGKPLVIYGPQGGGKSLLVYQLAATLMRDQQNIVVYINKATDMDLIGDIVEILYAQLCFLEKTEWVILKFNSIKIISIRFKLFEILLILINFI